MCYFHQHVAATCGHLQGDLHSHNSLPPNLLPDTSLQFQVIHHPGCTSPNNLIHTFINHHFTFPNIFIYSISINIVYLYIYIYIYIYIYLLQDYNSPHVSAVHFTSHTPNNFNFHYFYNHLYFIYYSMANFNQE